MVPEELKCRHHILALAEAPFGKATHLKFKWKEHIVSTDIMQRITADSPLSDTTLGIATPQKPMPAPMDRLSENIAIEAIACQENLLFTAGKNYSISFFCLLEEHTKFVN